MPARVKAHIAKQLEKAFKHTPKAKHVLENKETKPYVRCVSLNKSLNKIWDSVTGNVVTSFKFNKATEEACCNIPCLCCISLFFQILIQTKPKRGRSLFGELQQRCHRPQHFLWLSGFTVAWLSKQSLLSLMSLTPNFLTHFPTLALYYILQHKFLNPWPRQSPAPAVDLSHGAVITNPPVIQKNWKAGKMQQHQY